MTALDVKEFEAVPGKPKIDKNALALKAINDNWKGDSVGAATAAALDIGMLVAGCMCAHSKAKDNVLRGFEIRKVDEKWWSTVYEAFESGRSSLVTTAELHERFFSPANDNVAKALPAIDPRDWQGKTVPERKWFVDGWIPDRTVTNLSGDGGSGKTEIILQLIAASSLQTQWFGKDVSAGPCLYYGAEDEADELHRRLRTIVQQSGKQLSDLEGIRLIPMAGLDAVLAEPDTRGKLAATAIYPKLVSQAMELRPKLIVIDPSADVFGGDEINRAQVRKFVSMLRALAMEIDCAVLLLSHPSPAGMNTGTGTSGSTAWNNSVRSRLYLEITSPDTRVLTVVKANHGRVGEKVEMRWNDGVYVLDEGGDPVVQSLIDAKTDALFLDLLELFNEQNQHVGIVTGTTYAPAKMAGHPKAKGVTKKELAASMQRLPRCEADCGRNGRFKKPPAITFGSRRQDNFALAAVFHRPFHRTFHRLPPPSTGCVLPPPLYPHWRWKLPPAGGNRPRAATVISFFEVPVVASQHRTAARMYRGRFGWVE